MKTIAELGEFGLIDRLRRLIPTSPSVIEGIGDDCAVVRIFDRLMIVSCDMSMEGVHFRRDAAAPERIGWKAAASSMSDIGAMGGIPLFAMVTLGCPGNAPVALAEGLYHGMASVFSRYGVAVIGGDTIEYEKVFLDVTVFGMVRGKNYATRAGAHAGDLLAVTGPLGLSGAGLDAMNHGRQAPELVAAHWEPRPRILEGQWLCSRPEVHAMIDISDGLLRDAGHLAEASGLGVNVQQAGLYADPKLSEYCGIHGLDPVPFMLAGGEDYELAFALARDGHAKLMDSYHHEFRSPVYIVGEFTDEWAGVRVDGAEPAYLGFGHFLGEQNQSE